MIRAPVIRFAPVVLIAVSALALSGCVEEIKRDRVKEALMNTGISEPIAGCMSHRMAQKLTIAQLHHLEVMGGPKESWMDYVEAVGRVHDPDATEVLLSSYGLCKSGLIQ